MQTIPVGETASYSDIAERIGSPKAVRAVAHACASNPLAVAIPCHRVVRMMALCRATAGAWPASAHCSIGKPRLNALAQITRVLPTEADPARRAASLDWPGESQKEFDAQGCAKLERLLSAEQCRSVAALYPQDERFRSRVIMARHGFGRGEYKYFAYPLPDLIAGLRTALYRPLAVIANRWNAAMSVDVRYPKHHADFLERCHKAGQTRPTPLLLQYQPGDFNCLHQDLYGENVFPLQVAILLSEPGLDFTGGEFVLTEQRPRMQSRAEVVSLRQGDAVVFAVHHRPVEGTRGSYRVNMRHGVSRLRTGHRHTLGIIFRNSK